MVSCFSGFKNNKVKNFILPYLLILISSNFFGQNLNTDTVSIYKTGKSYTVNKFCMGVDLSYVNQVEDNGGVFKMNDVEMDPYEIFAKTGANTVRVRLWHNPDWYKDIYGTDGRLYSDLNDVTKTIQRSKEMGMAVNLDIHYSDVWADPGHQQPPEAWSQIKDIDVLKDSVYNYTFQTLHYLSENGIMPEFIQIGNETNCGMMISDVEPQFPNLNVCKGHFDSLGIIINADIQAVRDASASTDIKPKIILHVADPKNLTWWFENIIHEGKVKDFDIIGFSYYFKWHTEIPFHELGKKIAEIKGQFQKEVMIVETAYPFTDKNIDEYNNIFGLDKPVDGYPYTVQGQYNYLKDLTQMVIDAGGTGVMYWEPAWITSQMRDLWGKGSAWENNTLFDFQGNLLPSINYLTYPYRFPDINNKEL